MRRKAGWIRHPATPYVMAAAAGVLTSWLIVAFVVFPVDDESMTAEVPSVVGELYEAAATKLEAAGFTVERGEVRAVKSAAPGAVVEQDPGAGTQQKAGSAIKLHISTPRR